jgi:hypothetical protein
MIDVDAVQQQLWPRGGNKNVWMIVDGARDPKIYWNLTNSHLDCACLYSGDIPSQLEAVAPHLVQLEYDDTSTRDLIKRAWGRSWGVFVSSETSMHRLRRHLRTLLTVQDWRGKQLLFRFYDPRVLRVFIPTCRHDELKQLFGPVRQFAVESESAEELLTFDYAAGSLSHSKLSLIQGQSAATPNL